MVPYSSMLVDVRLLVAAYSTKSKLMAGNSHVVILLCLFRYANEGEPHPG